MELIILIIALALAVILAMLQSEHIAPSNVSEFELHRRREQGDQAAGYELYRREQMHAILGWRLLAVLVVGSGLATLLIATHTWWLGLILFFVAWTLATIVTASGWLGSVATQLHTMAEPRLLPVIRTLAPALRLLVPRFHTAQEVAIASHEELAEIIKHDSHLLRPDEKLRIQGAMLFGDLKVQDAMTPRDQIVTVDIAETVGPLLLDRLHKTKHHTFVAVKKDLDHVKGLVLMSDVTSGHPDLKKVADAVRPKVQYVPETAPLADVLGASLQTGRQLFIVVDDKDTVTGLITLGDVLAVLLGESPVAG